MEFEVEKYYRTAELGATFDNKIRSFRLKKGYSCTLANNPDGTGFSRVYIASDADIEVPEMPEGLEFVSFVVYSVGNGLARREFVTADLLQSLILPVQ